MPIRPSDIGLPEKFTSFREYPNFSQWETATRLASSEHAIRAVCAPPGAGKSLLNMTAATLLGGRTLYLTPTKQLQKQINDDFPSFNLVGHSNYPCADPSFDDSGSLADVGCLKPRSQCRYWQDIGISQTKDLVTTNPANWVSIARAGDPTRFGNFDNIVVDEAHNLASILCDMMAVKISRKVVDNLLGLRIPTNSTLDTWREWAREALSLCISEASDAEDDTSLEGRKRRLKLTRLSQDLTTIAEIRDEWIIKEEFYGNSLTPVGAEPYVDSYLFREISNVILSSATLTKYDIQMLGIKNYEFFEIGSVFDPRRRPFIYVPTVSVQYNTGDADRRLLLNQIDRCINMWEGYKGLVFSVNYENAKWITELARSIDKPCASRLITHGKDRGSKQRAFDAYFQHPEDDSVLVSPIISEGLDFADQLARFGIIVKVPTPNTSDPLVIAREKRYPSYKNNVRIKSIIQMVGRLVRNTSDWGTAYIFDVHWGKWMCKQPFPLYFRQTWERHDSLPAIRTF